MMVVLGWVVAALVVVVYVTSMSASHRRRLFLRNYIVFLLLSDRIRDDHKRKFREWLRTTRANDPANLGHLGHDVIESMAGSLAGDSTLAAWTMMLKTAQGDSVDEQRPEQASTLAADLWRMSEDDMEVVGAYGRVLEEGSNPGGPLHPESKLPYPKERIRRALMNALATIRDDESRKHLQNSLAALDDFIEDAHVPTDRNENASEWLKRRLARSG